MGPMVRLKLAVAMGVLLVCPTILRANDLKPETAGAWDKYVAAVKDKMQERASGQAPFLWAGEDLQRLQRAHNGEILIARTGGDGPIKVPHGMIHDWTGVIFVPGAHLGDVMRVLDDYEHYKDFYKPQVAQSSLMERTSDSEKIRLILVQSALGVTAAVEVVNDVQITQPNPTRAYTLSYSIHVHEIADYGKANEHQLVEDHGPGYVWRDFNITRLEERDGGVYIEEESIEMSRGIPIELRWMIKPLTERLARTIVMATMTNTQKAVAQSGSMIPDHWGPH
jgi:hypothetical protein